MDAVPYAVYFAVEKVKGKYAVVYGLGISNGTWMRLSRQEVQSTFGVVCAVCSPTNLSAVQSVSLASSAQILFERNS